MQGEKVGVQWWPGSFFVFVVVVFLIVFLYFCPPLRRPLCQSPPRPPCASIDRCYRFEKTPNKGRDGTDFKMGKDHTYVVTVSKRSYFLRFFSWSLSYLVFCIFCLWKLFSLKLSGTGKHVLSLFPFFCCSSFLHGKFSFTYFCWIIAYESR